MPTPLSNSRFSFIENDQMVVQTQCKFPRSKKKRIQRKWAKQSKYWVTYPDPNVLVMENKGIIVGHPCTLRALKASLPKVQPTELPYQSFIPWGEMYV